MCIQMARLEHDDISLSKSTSYSYIKPIHYDTKYILYKTLQVYAIKTT